MQLTCFKKTWFSINGTIRLVSIFSLCCVKTRTINTLLEATRECVIITRHRQKK